MVRKLQRTPLIIFALAALGTQPQLANAAQIYRCPQPDAPPLFSGTACNSAHQLDPVIINRYAPSPLTKAEQQQLRLLSQRSDRLNKIHGAKRSSGNRQKRSAGGANVRSASTPSALCARHQEALRALQNRRRKGYKLSEAERLENQEQSLRQNIRLTC